MNQTKDATRIGALFLLTTATGLVFLITAATLLTSRGRAAESDVQREVTPTVVILPPSAPDALEPPITPNATAQAISERAHPILPLVNDAKGVTIAEGTNSASFSLRNLQSYRVEEIRLARRQTFTVNFARQGQFMDRVVTVDKVWRVIVAGGPYREGGGDSLTLWLDDEPISTMGHVGQELRSLVFDPAPLRRGGMLGVGKGLDLQSVDYFTTKLPRINIP